MSNAIDFLVAGIMLCCKKNRNKFEEQAVKAFKRIIVAAFVPVLIYGIVVFVWLVPDLFRSLQGGAVYSSYIQRMGHVEDGQVRYVQGENKYVSLKKLNISEEDVEDGDDITLFFDTTTDELLFGKITKKQDVLTYIAFAKWFSSIIILVICYLLIVGIGKKRCFADFIKWNESTSAN